MASVGIAAGARRDIKRILRSLADKGGIAPAIAFSDSLVALQARLGSFPEAYASRPTLGASIRVAVISPYLILYRYSKTDDRVIILRALHGHRNITANFLKTP